MPSVASFILFADNKMYFWVIKAQELKKILKSYILAISKNIIFKCRETSLRDFPNQW